MRTVIPRPQRTLASPLEIASLAAWYDIGDASSLTVDGSNRVSLVADKSGNSSTNCLCLNGVAGNYASAPDSAALSITGDIDVRARLALNDWTPSASNVITAKWTETGNQRSYMFWVAASGALEFYISTTGADAANVTSSATPTVADFGTIWVRVTRVQSSGVVTFYTSVDGVVWTQLGITSVLSAGSAIFNSTSIFEVGSRNTGAQTIASGRIYRAQIYNGIAGTLVFDANFATASKLATSFTESSSNAATVTINQTAIALPARIIGERDMSDLLTASQPTYDAAARSLTFDGSNDYLKTAAFTLAEPLTIYFVGSQAAWTSGDWFYDGGSSTTVYARQAVGSPEVRNGASVTTGSTVSPSLGSNFILASVFNGSNSTTRLNRSTAVAGPNNPKAANGFTLMSRGDGAVGTGVSGTVNEVLIYAAAHDQATQDRVIAALSAKWGIQL